MLLDLEHGMLRQILLDFSNNPALHVGVEGVTQFCERACWGGDDDNLHLALAHEIFHRCRHTLDEAMFLKIVPIGRFHGGATIRVCMLECSAWAIGALLAGGRILVDEDAFGLEVWKFCIARIAQKQCLPAIANEHQSIVQKS